MFEVKRSKGPHGFISYTREVWGINGLEVEAGSTGYRGTIGDGGRHCFRIADLDGTRMAASADENGFAVELCGDSELDTMITALEFIVQTFKDARDGLNR